MKYTHADYELGFSYAGEEDSAKAMFRIITEEFDAELKNAQGKAPTERAHKALVEIYKNKTAKYLQTLVGICFKNTCFSLFRSSANLIVEGHTETIGSGDTSALRYLSDYLLREIPETVFEGEVLASYIVFVASRYVDGCGGGPDALLLHLDGGTSES